jgi:hypothetical protein
MEIIKSDKIIKANAGLQKTMPQGATIEFRPTPNGADLVFRLIDDKEFAAFHLEDVALGILAEKCLETKRNHGG